ncbi:hypothetical protein L1987_64028 [Smallanthus sonchifolius]|uniref:Uncharacterized protein n=1 Tax=Smallanthus sonchifolius TaxID=185202 RepID=A0ACB9CEV8_9ASTR|nr:hypothetical protein L1987_64028 [Smallanthus sonchifolius]
MTKRGRGERGLASFQKKMREDEFHVEFDENMLATGVQKNDGPKDVFIRKAKKNYTNRRSKLVPVFCSWGCFVWLFVIPVTQEYLRKYKFISAIDAFKKLKEDPDFQLLDIRDSKTLRVLGSPNLKFLNKNAMQVEFHDDEEFVKKVKESFKDPASTTICILDNFDGESMKVAELLFNNGFKEAYAIRGGVRGNNGWLEIQETLLPPSVHINLNRKVKKSTEGKNNGLTEQQSEVKSQAASLVEINQTDNGYANTSKKPNTRSSSPYPME